MKQKYLPIIDPGHGGVDPETGLYTTPGKRSPDFGEGVYFEGVGNRDIASKLGSMLDDIGWRYEYTVDVGEWRDVSLEDRVVREHSLNKHEATFFISIHSNGFYKESAHGTEVWTSKGFTGKSDLGASIFIEEFTKIFPDIVLRRDRSDGDVDKESNLFVLKRTLGPAFLIEPLFHTNRFDYKILISEKGRSLIAKSLLNTILEINRKLF